MDDVEQLSAHAVEIDPIAQSARESVDRARRVVPRPIEAAVDTAHDPGTQAGTVDAGYKLWSRRGSTRTPPFSLRS